MLALLLALLVQTPATPSSSAPASDPASTADRRNVQVPDTDTHVVLGDFPSKATWESHRARVKQQVLTAAGLDPLPERTPLAG